MTRYDLLPWSELFPDGRHIFYEGDEPEVFVEQIKKEFGFDPSADEHWGVTFPAVDEYDTAFVSYAFHCPVEHLDAIYGGDRFPMGS